MAKRKRENVVNGKEQAPAKKTKEEPKTPLHNAEGPLTIQIVAGSYDRVLHGVTATIDHRTSKPPKGKPAKESCQFADTFLFNAHASAIRCLALSPPSAPVPGQPRRVVLATGSSDERINLYHLSAHPPSAKTSEDQRLLSALTPRPVLENRKNHELGTLLHHSSTVTRLQFPTRSKLLSASEDSTVAVTRTRDWNLLHAFKAPVAKAQGRPSGDTAALGGAPAGVNDFAVHPSMKVMLTVSKGERCMRLWNLVTGKKARALNFARETLAEIGEGRHSTGEARRILWGTNEAGEDEFAVGFERDIVLFSMDCKPRCRVMGDTRTKVHEFCYVEVDDAQDKTVLAVSTEDGRILFFSTRGEDLVHKEAAEGKAEGLASAKLIAQLGGKAAGVAGRVKDFTILPVDVEDGKRSWYIAAGGSDGRLRLWHVLLEDLQLADDEKAGKQVGTLLGTYETQNRITCVGAFVMIPRPEGAEESEYEFGDESGDGSDDESEGGGGK